MFNYAIIMQWKQARDFPPPVFTKKAIAVYDDGSKQMVGHAYTEYNSTADYVCFEYNGNSPIKWVSVHHELSDLKWLDESESDHLVTLKAMFIRELKGISLITEAQLGAILDYMQKK